MNSLSSLIILSINLIISSASQDLDIIYFKSHNSTKSEIPISFTAFGQTIKLQLLRNDKLLAPYFQVWRHSDSNVIERLDELSKPLSCHYIHQDELITAAVSLCEEGLQGLVILNNFTLEITPLDKNEQVIFEDVHYDEEMPHVVKRSHLSSFFSPSSYSPYNFNSDYKYPYINSILDTFEKRPRRKLTDELTVELAVFFDEAGYKLFSPFFDHSEKKLRDMLLAYINAVQALFYHPSLGRRINIVLVRLDMMKHQPADLPHYNGERLKLLNSFCNYTAAKNPKNDDDPNHWDIGLYVSGLDFYAYENGEKNSVTMGLATVSGVCLNSYACVIAEFGVTNRFGKPYPSAGTQGETIWSSCSREVAIDLPRTKPCLLDKNLENFDKTLDHSRYLTLPGRTWTAKKQCELLLRDKDADVVTLTNACHTLSCRSPHRSGYYYAGPALEGTICEEGKECRGGECLPALHFLKPQSSGVKGNEGWSKWKEFSCISGCIKKSKGSKIRRRICNNSQNTNGQQFNEDCKGPHYDVMICKDEKLCKKRITAEEFATIKCQEFSEHLPELDKYSSGLQAPHEIGRPWMACAIFCRRKDIASYYTPRIELNDLGVDPYFPDGTWCHNENNQNYFCLQHHCLPEDFRFAKDALRRTTTDFNNLGPQNAQPDQYKIPDEVIKYLSLGINGLPLSKNFPSNVTSTDNEWTDDDYIELPDELLSN
ncbi:Similar to adt-1: A disintegrin and metalloproteinase with thrombospondin motifs adt-1 (Caenorhabditis elegans) [Cotesia congregata]|uniref:Similar to adt-1: A disintegrin and metalloproteinase with thrombospondin motifs adt-1 (Caenorhabditis elegans) n=1 Tax=Cotesia congregata TaxID=51543 RepID=A0A8J2HHV3_COTCN|nr:Similar to adt-1: A disintegrin and metalloproteinase with thrombospondin motifs adt-1 (Caenorhabditis elegans) [Cotesia congregata]